MIGELAGWMVNLSGTVCDFARLRHLLRRVLVCSAATLLFHCVWHRALRFGAPLCMSLGVEGFLQALLAALRVPLLYGYASSSSPSSASSGNS